MYQTKSSSSIKRQPARTLCARSAPNLSDENHGRPAALSRQLPDAHEITVERLQQVTQHLQTPNQSSVHRLIAGSIRYAPLGENPDN